MALGQILRETRLAKGLTASQVAANINLTANIIESLENEDFRRIAAPIYGKGFIRLYAELLEIDPAPLLKDYAELIRCKPLPELPKVNAKPLLQPKPVATPPTNPLHPNSSQQNTPTPQPIKTDLSAEEIPPKAPTPQPSIPASAPRTSAAQIPTPRRKGLTRDQLFTRDKSKPLFSAYTPIDQRDSSQVPPKTENKTRPQRNWNISQKLESLLAKVQSEYTKLLDRAQTFLTPIQARLTPIQWRVAQISVASFSVIILVLVVRLCLPSSSAIPTPDPVADPEDEIVTIPQSEQDNSAPPIERITTQSPLPPAYID